VLTDIVSWLVFVHFDSLQVPTTFLQATREQFAQTTYSLVFTSISLHH